MLYPELIAKVATQTFATDPSGNSYTFEIPADNALEELIVRVRLLTGTLTGAVNPDAAANYIARIQFNPGTQERQTIIDMSGPALLDYQVQTMGSLDYLTNTAYSSSAAATGNSYVINYRIPFVPPNVDDPVGSAFLCPLWKFPNNPTLQVTFNTSGTNMAATSWPLAANAVIEVFTIKRIVPQTLKTVPMELTEVVLTYPNTGNSLPQNLPSPGTYFNMMFRSYTTAGLRQDLTASGALWNSTYNLSQVALGSSTPYVFDFGMVYKINQSSWGLYVGGPNTGATEAACPMLDFVTDRAGSSGSTLGSLFTVDPALAPRPIFTTSIARAGNIKFVSLRGFPNG